MIAIKTHQVRAASIALSVLFTTPFTFAASFYGALSNFDAVNDTQVGGTGVVCHGFEIDLEGVTPAEVTYTFGSPYNRYGNPTKSASLSGTGTILRWEATYSAGAWSTYTPYAPPNTITTGGHQFWTGGDPKYPLVNGGVPGDHFGIGTTVNPTSTSYHWLIDNGTGGLISAPTTINLPAPTWSISPPAAPVAVQAIIPAPPKPAALFGPAIWVKAFITESTAPVALDDLLVGNPAVPGRDAAGNEILSEVEIEWQLLQAGFIDQLDSGMVAVGANAEAVSRRYEFYKYTGAYDIDGQALNENPLDPLTPNIVGDFIGAQNAALNLAALPVPEPASLSLATAGIALLVLRKRPRRQS